MNKLYPILNEVITIKAKSFLSNSFLTIFCLLIIFLKPIILSHNTKISNKNQQEIDDIVVSIRDNLNDDFSGTTKLIDIKTLTNNDLPPKLIKQIKKHDMKGCLILNQEDYEYFNDACSKYVIDSSISSNPIPTNDMIPVRYENNAYTKTDYMDWHNYEELEFAYAITSDYDFQDNEIIPNNKIKNLFIWIPSFHYYENKDRISYTFHGNCNMNNHFKYTTSCYLPFAFYFKNNNIYGFWVQLDDNNIESIKNSNSVDIHHITENEVFAVRLFEKHYNLKDTFIDFNNKSVISIGRGDFFEGEY